MVTLIGGASTASRGRRPLPRGAIRAISLTEHSIGVRELVEFIYPDGERRRQECLSWVAGQSGILWGAGPYPPEIQREFGRWEGQGSYGNSAEYRLADALGEVWGPYLKATRFGVRFFQSGGEACAAMARVMRQVTGKRTLCSVGYHGAAAEWAHLDEKGIIPGGQLWEQVSSNRHLEWGNLTQLEEVEGTAGLVVETFADTETNCAAYLKACQDACEAASIPFVVDEVVTGFRLALGGACERYGVKADAAILGKAVSATGGVAAVIGDYELLKELDDHCFMSTTFGGAPFQCSIAEKTVRHLQRYEDGIYGEAGHLNQIGAALANGLRELGLNIQGQNERSIIVFDGEPTRREWCSRMIERGCIVDRPMFSTLAHTPTDVSKTLEAARTVGLPPFK